MLTAPLLGIFAVSVRPYSVEVHLQPAQPERAPLLRININNRAHHVSAVLSAPAATARARDAGQARVAAPRGEDRGGVDVGVVEEEAGQF